MIWESLSTIFGKMRPMTPSTQITLPIGSSPVKQIATVSESHLTGPSQQKAVASHLCCPRICCSKSQEVSRKPLGPSILHRVRSRVTTVVTKLRASDFLGATVMS